MTVVFTEDRHAGEFILSEADGQRSRENGTIAAGQNLKAGTILMLSNSKLVQFQANTNTAGELETDAEGILIAPCDATDADTPAAYIDCDAEVNGNVLVYDDTTNGGEVALTDASLKKLGIKVRR